ncbi:MAG TPA: hypothetical protein VJ436_11025 [Anaerolineales bacterium]|nr:hypothetical protein [Anaerolineales bacterium]
MANDSGKVQPDDLLQRLLQQAETAEDYNMAAAFLSEAAMVDPENEKVANELYSLAQDLFFEQKYSSALPLFNLLRALWDEDNLDSYGYVLFYAGLSLINLNEFERGEALLREGLEFDPENPNFLQTMGYYFLNRGVYEEGIQYLKKLLDDFSGEQQEFLEILEAILWARYKQNRKKQGLHFLLDYFDNYGDDEAVKLYLRFVRLLKGQTGVDALEHLLSKIEELEAEELIDISTQVYYEIHIELSWRYYQIAEELFGTAESQSEREEVQELGNSILNLLLKETDRATKLSPENPVPYLMRARALLIRREFEAALQAAESGLSLAGTNNQATVSERINLKSLDLLSAPSLSENDPSPGLLLAKVDALTGLERLGEALNTLEQTQALFPSEVIYYRYAAALLWKMGKPQEALAQFKLAHNASVKFDKPTRSLEKKIKAGLAQGK